jgi:GDP-L-fucose synthase
MEKNSKICVMGHRGLVGSALVKELYQQGFENLVYVPRQGPYKVDLRDPTEVRWWFSCTQPEYVFLAAARVGGIKANIANPAEFLVDNLRIQENVMLNAAEYGCKKLVFLGSSCIYPKNAEQPIKESSLLTGPLEPTNQGYALAKICGVKLGQFLKLSGKLNVVSAMPCNLFGSNDFFHENDGHLVPGLIARLHKAKCENAPEFVMWGDGTARRELLYSEDLARALILVMKHYEGVEPINTGSSEEWTVRNVAETLAQVVGYRGKLVFDASQPVGVTRKIMDNSEIFGLGWTPKINPLWAFHETYENFLTNPEGRRGTG